MKRIFIFLVAIFCIQTGYAQTRILPLGESTTDFGPSWRRKFCQLLTADGLNYDMVGPKNDEATDYDGNHAGYSGYPASSVQKEVESFYSSHPADMVLIWEGTNDCGWASTGGSTAALSSLIDKVCQLYPNAKVLVASIPPMGSHAYTPNIPTGQAAANAKIYNDALPALCQTKASEGKKVVFVDATSLTLSDLINDGIHPNQTGYDKMGTIFYNAVKNNLVVTAVSSVTLPSTALISNQGTVQLTANVLPVGASYKNITWSSNNTSVATVSSTGLVTAVANGSAVITVTSVSDNTKKGTCTVTVTSSAAVTSVSLPSITSVAAGATVSLSATVSPTNALQSVTWSSTNTSVATVSSSGVVSGLFVGTAVIMATSTSDVTKSASSTVTVTAPPSKTEAEDGIFTGVKKASNHTGYSGTGFVDNFQGPGTSLAFTTYAATAGSYNVTLRYANAHGHDRTLSIYVNGTKIRQTSLPSQSNSWSSWSNKVEALTLTAGVNTIMYKYDSGDNGQVNIDYIDVASNGATTDTEKPTVPSGLSTESLTSTSFTLKWNASTDNVSVTGYEVFQGSTSLGTTTSLSYNVTGLTVGTTYSMTVKAKDAANNSSDASAALSVTTTATTTLRDADNPASTSAGLDYKYYEGNWSVLPNFDALTAAKQGNVTNFDLTPRNRDDNFGFKFSGYVNVPSDGTYTFYTSSDDGSKLYIGSTEVVSNDFLQDGSVERSGSIGLKAGKHAITVVFFEASGGQLLTVSYSSSSIAKTTIPASALYRAATSTTATDRTDPVGTGTITARGDYANAGEGKDKAFDNSKDTKWLDFSATSWIQFQFAGTAKYAVSKYTITSANDEQGRDPRDWKLYGTNVANPSSSELFEVDSQSNVTFDNRYQKKEFTVSSNTTPYRAYRLVITANKSAGAISIIQLAEVELFAPDCSGCRISAEAESIQQRESLTLQVHPNPTTSEVTISLAGFEEESAVQLQMRDMSGKSFLHRQVQPSVEGNQVTLPLSQLPQGLFFVTVQGSKTAKTAKLIITK